MAEYYSEESVPFDEDDSTVDSDDEDLNFSGAESDDGGVKKSSGSRWQVLSPDMISKKMFDIIHDVNAVFEVCMCVRVFIIKTLFKESLYLVDTYY